MIGWIRSVVLNRIRGRSGWMGELSEGERRGQCLIDAGVGLGKEEVAGLNKWVSGVRVRGRGRAGCLGE